MKPKKLLLLLFIILTYCKSNMVEVRDQEQIQLKPQCPLIGLKKTMDYKNGIETLAKDHKNKVIEMETTEMDSVKYSSMLHLKESSQYLWLVKNNLGNNIDSILIHCIDPTKSVESEFDLDNCEIEILETEFLSSGEPKMSLSKTIQF